MIVPASEPVLTLLESEHLATEHWCEGECRSSRYSHDDTHHPTQLLEEHTCHTRNHGQWEEHTYHGECRSDNRDRHLVGTMNSSLLRVTTLLNMVCDVLQYYDGIIDDVTDGDTQT